MTSIASTTERALPAARGGAALDRLLAAAPLVASYLILVLVYAWHGLSHGSPWLFSDELEYTQLSRAIAETGEPAQRGEPHGFISLYTYLLAPVWWISDVQTAYDAAKYLGAFVMTSALFPAYGLARMVAPRWPAIFAGVATAAVPMLAYSRLLLTEVVAYPFAALAFFLMAKALVSPQPRWIVPAVAAAAVAPFVRSQLIALPAVFAGAALVSLWLSDRVRRFRADWGPVRWAAAIVGLATIVWIAHHQLIRHSFAYYEATTLPDRVLAFSVWAWGAFVIGIGILPALCALVVLWRPGEASRREYRALAGLLVCGIVAFGAYTALKTVYLSTVFANIVAERNLVYLAPLVFAATALFFARPAANAVVVAAAGALLVYLTEETPYQLDHYPYFDAPGLSSLAVLNRAPIYLSDAAIEDALLWTVAGLAAIVLAAGLLRRGRAVLPWAFGVLGVLVIAWNLTGLVAFGNGINDLSNRLRGSIPAPPNWIDAVTGGRPTAYVGQGIADPNPLYLTEFWNRSITAVATLDDTAIEPGRTLQLVPYARDGRVVNDPGVDYVVTNTFGVDPRGEEAYRTGDWRLYRVERPLRLNSAIAGVHVDGWMGERAVYSYFGRPGEKGSVEVVTSREAWNGPDKPAKVTVRVGSLVPAPLETIANPCAGGECVSREPRIGTLYGERTWTIHSGRKRLFRIPATAPFKVEVTVDPTFSPVDYGGSDMRQLGAQVAFAFKPSGP